MAKKELTKRERKIALREQKIAEKQRIREEKLKRAQAKRKNVPERLRADLAVRVNKRSKVFLFIDHTNKKFQFRVNRDFYPIMDKTNVVSIKFVIKKQVVEKTTTYAGPNYASSYGTFSTYSGGEFGFGSGWSTTNLPEYKKRIMFEYQTTLLIKTKTQKYEIDLKDDKQILAQVREEMKKLLGKEKILKDEKDYSQIQLFLLPKLKELIDSKMIKKSEAEKIRKDLLDLE